MSIIDEFAAGTLEDLPTEEDDVTATELHNLLVQLIKVGLEWRLMGRALVLKDIFVATSSKQVAPDVLVRFGAEPGERSRYLVDVDGVPEVTIEILSTVNHTTEGLIKLQEKRDLLGEIGVAEHIEIDPTTLTIQVWSSAHGLSRSVFVGKAWRSEVLGVSFRFDGQRFEAVDDGGRAFEAPVHALARAEAERERADVEHERAQRFRRLLEEHGIDAEA